MEAAAAAAAAEVSDGRCGYAYIRVCVCVQADRQTDSQTGRQAAGRIAVHVGIWEDEGVPDIVFVFSDMLELSTPFSERFDLQVGSH